MNKEQLAKDYANRNFESTTYHYTDDKRLTDFEKIREAYIEGYEKAIEVVAEYLSNTENHHFKDNDFYISPEYLKQTYKFLNEQ